MKRLTLIAALGAAALLAGCGPTGLTLGAPGGASSANSALGNFLSDPNCAHHDEATFVSGAGGLPASFQAKVMRDCPARPVAPIAAGAVVAPADPAKP